jgi:bifunctional non-homologous end joining protein LigD
MSEVRSYDGQQVELGNLDKLFFPGSDDGGITKGDIVDYYERVADWMLPHLKDRPLSLERYPDGIEGEGFYQKQTPDYFPEWVATASVPIKGEGGSQSQIVCDGKATLVYLANQACITPHVWLSRRDRLDYPDRMVFDLDPTGEDFEPVRRAARFLRELLEETGLASFLMLTGSRGAHVVVPLRRNYEFERVRSLARAVADRLASRRPEELTTAQRKEARGQRLFLDTTRNAYAQTTVAPYAVRARPGAPVATPIEWDELSDATSNRYRVRNLFRRLAQKDDPWRDIGSHSQDLTEPERRLASQRESL